METFGDQFLAGAPLTDHQHRPVERRGTAGALDGIEESETLANESLGAFHPASWCIFPRVGKLFPTAALAEFR